MIVKTSLFALAGIDTGRSTGCRPVSRGAVPGSPSTPVDTGERFRCRHVPLSYEPFFYSVDTVDTAKNSTGVREWPGPETSSLQNLRQQMVEAYLLTAHR
jgi:hypothetical protein